MELIPTAGFPFVVRRDIFEALPQQKRLVNNQQNSQIRWGLSWTGYVQSRCLCVHGDDLVPNFMDISPELVFRAGKHAIYCFSHPIKKRKIQEMGEAGKRWVVAKEEIKVGDFQVAAGNNVCLR